MRKDQFQINKFLEIEDEVIINGPFHHYKTVNKINSPSIVQIFSFAVDPNDSNNIYYENFKKLVSVLEQINKEPHSNIPKILSSGTTLTGSFPFIEMEYIGGGSLNKILLPNSFISIKEISKICEQLSRTLAYCHNYGFIHGNINTKCIFHNTAANKYILTGFGQSVFLPGNNFAITHQNGQMQFVAPGKYNDKFPFQNDVYDFALVFYKLLTGRDLSDLYEDSVPAKESFLSEIYSLRTSLLPSNFNLQERQYELNIPDWLPELIYKCLLKVPGHRINNGVELYDFILLNGLSKINKKPEVEIIKSIENDITNKLPEKPINLVKKQSKKNKTSPYLRTSIRRNNKKLYTAGVIAFIALSGFLMVYLGTQNKNETSSYRSAVTSQPVAVVKPTAKDSLSVNFSIKKADQDKTLHKTPVRNKRSANLPTSNKTTKEQNSIPRKIIHPWKPQGTSLDMNNGLGYYRVLSKAYFHNTPDEKTRRNAFIVHWNNAILKPIEEKNNFIYIVFTNIWGQTSKGWISKKDLFQVDN